MTVVTQILDRLDSLLKASVPAGTTVWRERTDAQAREEVPSVNVIPKDDPVEPFSGEMDRHQLVVELRIAVRADVPTPVAEAQHQAFHRALVKDPALRALCDSVRLTDGSFEREEADLTSLIKAVRYRFTYLIDQSTL